MRQIKSFKQIKIERENQPSTENKTSYFTQMQQTVLKFYSEHNQQEKIKLIIKMQEAAKTRTERIKNETQIYETGFEIQKEDQNIFQTAVKELNQVFINFIEKNSQLRFENYVFKYQPAQSNMKQIYQEQQALNNPALDEIQLVCKMEDTVTSYLAKTRQQTSKALMSVLDNMKQQIYIKTLDKNYITLTAKMSKELLLLNSKVFVSLINKNPENKCDTFKQLKDDETKFQNYLLKLDNYEDKQIIQLFEREMTSEKYTTYNKFALNQYKYFNIKQPIESIEELLLNSEEKKVQVSQIQELISNKEQQLDHQLIDENVNYIQKQLNQQFKQCVYTDDQNLIVTYYNIQAQSYGATCLPFVKPENQIEVLGESQKNFLQYNIEKLKTQSIQYQLKLEDVLQVEKQLDNPYISAMEQVFKFEESVRQMVVKISSYHSFNQVYDIIVQFRKQIQLKLIEKESLDSTLQVIKQQLQQTCLKDKQKVSSLANSTVDNQDKAKSSLKKLEKLQQDLNAFMTKSQRVVNCEDASKLLKEQQNNNIDATISQIMTEYEKEVKEYELAQSRKVKESPAPAIKPLQSQLGGSYAEEEPLLDQQQIAKQVKDRLDVIWYAFDVCQQAADQHKPSRYQFTTKTYGQLLEPLLQTKPELRIEELKRQNIKLINQAQQKFAMQSLQFELYIQAKIREQMDLKNPEATNMQRVTQFEQSVRNVTNDILDHRIFNQVYTTLVDIRNMISLNIFDQESLIRTSSNIREELQINNELIAQQLLQLLALKPEEATQQQIVQQLNTLKQKHDKIFATAKTTQNCEALFRLFDESLQLKKDIVQIAASLNSQKQNTQQSEGDSDDELLLPEVTHIESMLHKIVSQYDTWIQQSKQSYYQFQSVTFWQLHDNNQSSDKQIVRLTSKEKNFLQYNIEKLKTQSIQYQLKLEDVLQVEKQLDNPYISAMEQVFKFEESVRQMVVKISSYHSFNQVYDIIVQFRKQIQLKLIEKESLDSTLQVIKQQLQQTCLKDKQKVSSLANSTVDNQDKAKSSLKKLEKLQQDLNAFMTKSQRVVNCEDASKLLKEQQNNNIDATISQIMTEYEKEVKEYELAQSRKVKESPAPAIKPLQSQLGGSYAEEEPLLDQQQIAKQVKDRLDVVKKAFDVCQQAADQHKPSRYQFTTKTYGQLLEPLLQTKPELRIEELKRQNIKLINQAQQKFAMQSLQFELYIQAKIREQMDLKNPEAIKLQSISIFETTIRSVLKYVDQYQVFNQVYSEIQNKRNQIQIQIIDSEAVFETLKCTRKQFIDNHQILLQKLEDLLKQQINISIKSQIEILLNDIVVLINKISKASNCERAFHVVQESKIRNFDQKITGIQKLIDDYNKLIQEQQQKQQHLTESKKEDQTQQIIQANKPNKPSKLENNISQIELFTFMNNSRLTLLQQFNKCQQNQFIADSSMMQYTQQKYSDLSSILADNEEITRQQYISNSKQYLKAAENTITEQNVLNNPNVSQIKQIVDFEKKVAQIFEKCATQSIAFNINQIVLQYRDQIVLFILTEELIEQYVSKIKQSQAKLVQEQINYVKQVINTEQQQKQQLQKSLQQLTDLLVKISDVKTIKQSDEMQVKLEQVIKQSQSIKLHTNKQQIQESRPDSQLKYTLQNNSSKKVMNVFKKSSVMLISEVKIQMTRLFNQYLLIRKMHNSNYLPIKPIFKNYNDTCDLLTRLRTDIKPQKTTKLKNELLRTESNKIIALSNFFISSLNRTLESQVKFQIQDTEKIVQIKCFELVFVQIVKETDDGRVLNEITELMKQLRKTITYFLVNEEIEAEVITQTKQLITKNINGNDRIIQNGIHILEQIGTNVAYMKIRELEYIQTQEKESLEEYKNIKSVDEAVTKLKQFCTRKNKERLLILLEQNKSEYQPSTDDQPLCMQAYLKQYNGFFDIALQFVAFQEAYTTLILQKEMTVVPQQAKDIEQEIQFTLKYQNKLNDDTVEYQQYNFLLTLKKALNIYKDQLARRVLEDLE
ncbi:Hypothetical_protein [Hexamita inflata]|uniref:Hypothetical_protein n=1 Tax=Hexamita inflata TaxID=28002 RepID=A0AA86QRA3_9EUKA|nr:Hypothetical protein HINF_LOCUS13670 [Hexamita inflata]CAI9962618.1 Hypothetical protein HINF_LOCUS50263 [Hexamita inflata]